MGGVTFPVDPAVREAMARGSDLLLAAVQMARAGIDPRTSSNTVGLPRLEPVQSFKPRGTGETKRRPKPKPGRVRKLDIFAEYLAAGYEPEEAAQIMGYWHGRQGNALLQRIRSELGAQAV